VSDFFMLGSVRVYWGSFVTALSLLASLILTLSLYLPRRREVRPVLALYLLGFVLGGGLARLFHWYFNAEMYSGFVQAFTDFTVGGYVLPGMLIGIGISAWALEKLRVAPSAWELLDCASPGTLLFIAGLRLSALWDDSCRGLMQITKKSMQKLPFAVMETDAVGNVSWTFATFMVSFVLIFFLAAVMYFICRSGVSARLSPGAGDTARWSLLFYGAVEIVMDSTRCDSPLMHFRFLTDMNQYSAFISLAQIFAGVCALAILIGYSVRSIRAGGFRILHAAMWLIFAVSLFGIGKLGEYDVQRYASYARSYTIMILSVLLMLGSIYGVFQSCPGEED